MANPRKGEKIYVKPIEFSSWTLALKNSLQKEKLKKIIIGKMPLSYFICTNSLWLLYNLNNKGYIALRTCFDPGGVNFISKHINGYTAKFKIKGSSGSFDVRIENKKGTNLLRVTCTLKQTGSLRITYIPRDVYALDKYFNPLNTEGIIYTVQHGPCSGTVYFSLKKPAAGTALYFQNFTALNKYFQQTRTEPMDCVGGLWPEMGTALPICESNCITQGEVTLSDFFINFSGSIPKDEYESSRLFLDLLSEIYLEIPKPRAEYFDWPGCAKTTIKTLSQSKQCYRLIRNNFFLNPYVDTSDKPPESMVQLSVLVPLLEYCSWSGNEGKIIRKLKRSIEFFYSKKLKTIVRWLPIGEFKKSDRSEEEHHHIMDSWYHLHILLNLARVASKGDEIIKKMFLNSVEYAIKAAHKFNYNWPVFYDINSLNVIKAETESGRGGELDVPGVYCHVMLQVYDITKEERYLKEAECAAKKLKGMGLQLIYQSNITIFNAVALARLWQITGNKLYLDLSILCAANVINRFWIWNCNYGYAKFYDTFMGLIPLHDAKYMAIYEESETFAALYKLVSVLREKAPPSMRILIAEYMKYLLHRGKYYYPVNLPMESISENPRNGKINRLLNIPIEDLQHGWEKSGQVGQEVYGAANPFVFVSCAYRRPAKLPFSIYCNYPYFDIQFKREKGKGELFFLTGGMESLNCSARLLAGADKKLKNVTVKYRVKNTIKFRNVLKINDEYIIPGNSEVIVNWTENNK